MCISEKNTGHDIPFSCSLLYQYFCLQTFGVKSLTKIFLYTELLNAEPREKRSGDTELDLGKYHTFIASEKATAGSVGEWWHFIALLRMER